MKECPGFGVDNGLSALDLSTDECRHCQSGSNTRFLACSAEVEASKAVQSAGTVPSEGGGTAVMDPPADPAAAPATPPVVKKGKKPPAEKKPAATTSPTTPKQDHRITKVRALVDALRCAKAGLTPAELLEAVNKATGARDAQYPVRGLCEFGVLLGVLEEADGKYVMKK